MSVLSTPSNSVVIFSDLRIGECFVVMSKDFQIQYFYRKMTDQYAYNFSTNRVAKLQAKTQIEPVRLRLTRAEDSGSPK